MGTTYRWSGETYGWEASAASRMISKFSLVSRVSGVVRANRAVTRRRGRGGEGETAESWALARLREGLADSPPLRTFSLGIL